MLQGNEKLLCCVAMGLIDDVTGNEWFGRPINHFLEAAGWSHLDVWPVYPFFSQIGEDSRGTHLNVSYAGSRYLKANAMGMSIVSSL